ncbi:Major Facilitator Superfamily (MFS) [Phytophthora infestans T30-4]|uniref:Major Facilitator Superfamily (MFS) n=1 Tax=Phytophthora infestans (strain T30-4) TaxID=403677 RepID=D0NK29_PHYIT|nr:Major Facilitator Superfamily (MFS) [Phytophthora infestans T30-4]EEY59866.1 Major Facilitator Superfamily (MFS) [Phytophthora infestans T30-4]|eukprot:XP_002900551.1 Major Facilitator Superfamily (MFS) [Phytophthora infestans T30-4]
MSTDPYRQIPMLQSNTPRHFSFDICTDPQQASIIIGRLIVGPLCDRYGARIIQSVLLVIGAIPVASATLVTSDNAISCGWGNLGAGVTYLVTPLVFDLITFNGTISDNYGWRMAYVFPVIIKVAIGVCTYLFSDDCPQGSYVDLKRNHAMADRAKSELYNGFMAVARQPIAWILAFHYACCFGVELQVHNVLSLYFYEDIKTDSAISSCFGLMCIFARAIGGYASDVANHHYDMKGRISMQLLCLVGQAAFLYLFSQLRVLAWSIPCLFVFGFFAQASTGTTYGIVSYVCLKCIGVTSGIVGAGGSRGGFVRAFIFKGVAHRAKFFKYLSFVVAAASISSVLIRINGERSLWSRGGGVSVRGPRHFNCSRDDTAVTW